MIHDFSITQILHGINFIKCIKTKTAYFVNLRAQNFAYRIVAINSRGYYYIFTKFWPEISTEMRLIIEVRLLFKGGYYLQLYGIWSFQPLKSGKIYKKSRFRASQCVKMEILLF